MHRILVLVVLALLTACSGTDPEVVEAQREVCSSSEALWDARIRPLVTFQPVADRFHRASVAFDALEANDEFESAIARMDDAVASVVDLRERIEGAANVLVDVPSEEEAQAVGVEFRRAYDELNSLCRNLEQEWARE